MTRIGASNTVRVMVVAALLAAATQAKADPVTLNYSGSVDIPPEHTFSGSITWDPDALPFEDEADLASYDPLSYVLIHNGVDVSAPVIGDGTGSGVVVINDGDPLGFGSDVDALAFFLATGGELNYLAVLVGPTTMFDSTDLPDNLNFLSQLTSTQSLVFLDEGGDGLPPFADGPLEVSAPGVPEPATLALLTLGLAGAITRRRASRRRTATPL